MGRLLWEDRTGEIPQGKLPEEAHRPPMESESFPRPLLTYNRNGNLQNVSKLSLPDMGAFM